MVKLREKNIFNDNFLPFPTENGLKICSLSEPQWFHDDYAKISKARREEIEDIKTLAKYRRKIPDIVKSEDTQMYCFACNEDTIERLPFLE